ncbi:MAG: tetratricopeptide repeat protein [Rudaea sp.]
MTLAQMESRFFELKGKLAVGNIGEDEFKREMEKLRFQDQHGRWWMIGAQSGRWYYYDGTRWQLGQPPADEANPPVSEPELDASEPARPAPAAPSPVRAAPPPVQTNPLPPAIAAAQASIPPAPKPATPFPARLREPASHGPTLADKVREEMARVHTPQVHVPDVHVPVHVPTVHAPAPIRRFSPNLILLGAALIGLVLVAVMWLAVDNLVPGKPISSFLGRGFANPSAGTPTARPTGTAQNAANVETMLHVADELTAKSQLGPALAGYQDVARLSPNNADIYTHWARALALAGRIRDAADTAGRATKLDKNSADAYAELARALAWSGERDDSVKAGEKAVELDDKNATAHAFLAEAYLRAGRTEDAGKEADRASQLDAEDVDAHRAAGWVAVLAKQQDQAVSEWKRVTELAPDVFFYHYEFGQVYGSYFGDLAGAAAEYQKAIALFGPYVPSYIALGRINIAQNQPGPAILQFQKALTFDGGSNEALVGMGLAFQKQGRCQQAIPYFQQSLQLDPKGDDALRGLAECGALPQGQASPPPKASVTAELNAVPTAIVQATVVPLAAATPTSKAGPASSTAAAPGPAGAGRIGFSTYDGQYHLYVANADGSNRKLVTELASQPSFSPDGSQLLFYSWTSDQRGVHRIEADGSSDESVSLHVEDHLPSWSPDGTRFVYATRAGPGSDLSKRSYHLRISDPTARPGEDPDDFTIGQYPAWGPKDRIAFRDCGLTTLACGLALIDPDGANKRELTNINSTAPAWSRDGRLIAFTSDYGGNWDIYIISSSGGSPARLTTDPAEDGLPAFSPDGKQIAFVSRRDGSWSVWAMGIDGSNQHKLFDLGGELSGNVPGNPAGQPGQAWWEQKISWQ